MSPDQTQAATARRMPPTEQAAYTHDVFISYSRANRRWVREDLLPRLEEAGLKVLIDDRDFPYGESVLDSIEKAVERSRHTLAVLTQFWLDGEWTTHERHLILLIDPSSRSRRLIPLLLEQCPLPKSIAHLNYVDFTDVTRRKEALAKLLRELGKSQEVINETVTLSAQKGLRAFIDLMQTAAVRDAVGDFEDARRDAYEQIGVLNRYKGLHEHFHNAESSYELVLREKKSLLDETGSWDEVEAAALELDAEVQPLLRFARTASFPASEILWTTRLERGQQDLLAAVERQDTKLLKNAAERIYQVIGQIPTQLNDRLFTAAADLPLSKLVKKLRIVGGGLKDLALEEVAVSRFKEFQQGLGALEQLDQSLRAFVTNHNCLQEIDNQLRPFDVSSELNPDELRRMWEDLEDPMNTLTGASGAEWMVQFRTVSNGLNEALTRFDLAAPDRDLVKRIRSLFLKYRSLVSQGFKQVDQDLKIFCEQLQKVGETLGREIQRIQHA